MKRWAWSRLHRFPEGALLEPVGLDWLALALLATGRRYLRFRWRCWTLLPGDAVYDLQRMLYGRIVKVRRGGRLDVICVTREAMRRDPLALDRVPSTVIVMEDPPPGVTPVLLERWPEGPVLRRDEAPHRWVR